MPADKDETKRIKDLIKFLNKDRKILEKQLKLAKRTISGCANAIHLASQGHTPDWDKVVNLINECEDEMDIDDNE